MSGIYEGESWRCADKRKPAPDTTRAELQQEIDSLYLSGKITLGQWRLRTDELSEPTRACK